MLERKKVEQAFIFSDEQSCLLALDLVEELSSRFEISYHPLGSMSLGYFIAVVPENICNFLQPLFTERGIKFDIRQVGSIGELTREERIELRKTGRKIG